MTLFREVTPFISSADRQRGNRCELDVTSNVDGGRDLAASSSAPLTDFKYVYLLLPHMTWDFKEEGMCQPAANWAKKPSSVTNKTTRDGQPLYSFISML